MNNDPTTKGMQERILARLHQHSTPFDFRWEHARNQTARWLHNTMEADKKNAERFAHLLSQVA